MKEPTPSHARPALPRVLLEVLTAIGAMTAACGADPVTSDDDTPALEISFTRQWNDTYLPQTAPPCPQEMAHVGSTCIDRWEAHLVLADTPDLIHPYYARPEPNVRYLARSAGGFMPQAYVSRNEAAAACRLAGKRLCTGPEWRRACRGKGKTLYPYGAEEIPGRCNTGKPHLPTILFGMNSTAVNGNANYNSPQLAQEPGFLAKAGEYAGCVTGDGVFDMDGNLHEWVSDRPNGSPLHPRAVFVGGFFSSTPEHGAGCQHVSRRHSPLYHDYSTGFRCCRDEATAPQPDVPND